MAGQIGNITIRYISYSPINTVGTYSTIHTKNEAVLKLVPRAHHIHIQSLLIYSNQQTSHPFKLVSMKTCHLFKPACQWVLLHDLFSSLSATIARLHSSQFSNKGFAGSPCRSLSSRTTASCPAAAANERGVSPELSSTPISISPITASSPTTAK